MALTPFQRRICRLLAEHRLASGESYVAGATPEPECFSTLNWP
jgi:hypothetical protein